ncbi:MAG TPA: SRPBCC family protein [Sphingomicrobium sp.]|jgi:uncharacterized protein YndB with AHSA1/START domain|nr:SRPBCC family protein [Sphingomicrobium sp.]
MADVAQQDFSIERTAPDTIRMERMLDAPADTVWRYLVDGELRAQWFAGGSDARPDGDLDLLFDHDRLSADDVPCPEEYAKHKGHASHEKVVRFEPKRVLAFTFGEGKNGVATFELFPQGDDRTRLVLTHSGITSPTGDLDFGSGWSSHLAVLQAKLAGGSVRNFWALHEQSRAAVREALG